jgi:hypothetical protein
MANTVAIDVKINALEASKTLKDLKTNLKDAVNELAGLESGTQEFNKLASAVDDAKDRIEKLNKDIEQVGGAGKFGAIADFGSKIAAGFEVAQGAMALFGSESEEVKAALEKVQAAMALTQGLKDISEFGKSWTQLKSVVSDFGKSAMTALQGMKAGIAATGIGVLLIAVGALVAYWDDIKEAVSGVSDEQEELNSKAKQGVEIAKNKLDATSRTENSLKLQGKTEREILQIKIAQTDQIIKATEIQLKQNINTIKAQLEAEKRNKEILEGILKFISAPITLVLKTVDMLGKALGKDWGLEDKFFGKVSELVFNPSKVAEDGIKTITETQKQLEELKNTKAGYILKLRDLDKKEVTNTKEKTEEKNKIEKDYLKDLERNRLEEIQNLKNQQAELEANGLLTVEKRKEIAEAIYQLETKKAGLMHEDLEKLRIEHNANLKKIDDDEAARIEKHNQEMLEGVKKDQADQLSEYDTRIKTMQRLQQNSDALELEAAKYKLDTIKNDKLKSFEEQLAAQEEFDAKVAEIDKRDAERKKRNSDFAINTTQTALQTTADLIGAFAGKSREQQKKAFEAQKAINIASAVIATYQNAVTAYQSQFLPIPDPSSPIRGAIAATVAVAAGVANIRKIEQTKFDSKDTPSAGGGGGGGGSFAPNLSAPVGNTSTNLASIGFGNQEQPEPVKVFVTETDISSSQKNVQKIEQKASIE